MNAHAQPAIGLARPEEKTSDKSYEVARPIPTDTGEFYFMDQADRDRERMEARQ